MTYKITTPMMVVASLNLHLDELPYAQLSHPELLDRRVLLLLLSLSLSLLDLPLLLPWATYEAKATHALNQNTV